MTKRLFANNAGSTLSTDISATQDIIALDDAAGFPAVIPTTTSTLAITTSTGPADYVRSKGRPTFIGESFLNKPFGGNQYIVPTGLGIMVGTTNLGTALLKSSDGWVTGFADNPVIIGDKLDAITYTIVGITGEAALLAFRSNNSAVYKSIDLGVTWSLLGTTDSATPYSSTLPILFDGTTYFAAAGNTVYTSADLITWTTSTATGIGSAKILWDGTQYVAVSSGVVFRSADGVAWTNTTPVGSPQGLVLVGGTFYMSVWNSPNMELYSSADGITWGLVSTIFAGFTGDGLVTNGTNMVAYGSGANVIVSTDTGATWTAKTVAGGTVAGLNITATEGLAHVGTLLYISTDLFTTTTEVTTPVGTFPKAVASTGIANAEAIAPDTGVGILYFGGVPIKTGAAGSVTAVATDGAPVERIAAITDQGEVITAVSPSYTFSVVVSSGLPAGVTDLVWDKVSGLWVAVGPAGGTYTSLDLAAWATKSNAIVDDFSSIAAGWGVMVVSAGVNKVYTSIDGGATWVDAAITGVNATGVSAYAHNLYAYGDDGAAGGALFTSSDGGTTWVSMATAGLVGDVKTVMLAAAYQATNFRATITPSVLSGDALSLTLSDKAESTFEVVLVDYMSGNIAHVTRGHEGTAISWLAGTKASIRVTADFLARVVVNQAPTPADRSLTVTNTPPVNPVSGVFMGDSITSFSSESVVIGNDAFCNDSNAVVIGYLAGANYTGDVAIGAGAYSYGYDEGFGNFAGLAIGRAAYCAAYGSTAVGAYASTSPYTSRNGYNTSVGCRAYSADDSVALGFEADAHGNGSVSIGKGSQARDTLTIVVGNLANCGVSSAGSIAVGYSAKCLGADSLAIGHSAYSGTGTHNIAIGHLAKPSVAASINTICVGYKAYALGNDGVALGSLATAGLNSVAIGGGMTNTQADTVMLRGPITVQASKVSTANHLDFAGAEVVLMTEKFDLLTVANTTIALPAGAIFLPTSAGIMVGDQTGVITTQATVEASTSTDNISFPPLAVAGITTALVAPRTFEEIAAGPFTGAATYLRASVTVAGSSTLLYNARMYFKGIMVQE